MARLKHDHSGWRSHGLYKKYQSPAVDEAAHSRKTKKNTRKWCRGKVGTEHVLRRYFWHTGWESKRTNWIRSKCVVCGKEFRNKDKSIPLTIELDERDGKSYPIQVKVNGIAIPIDYKMYHDGRHWCYACDEWHFD